MLNGIKVERRGKGQPPASDQETVSPRSGRRSVPGQSYFNTTDLLDLSRPATADGLQSLHFQRRAAATHNRSSLSGGGAAVLPAKVHLQHKACRRPGTANPGRGISGEMSETLAFRPDEQMRSQASRLWQAVGQPTLTDTVIRHRTSDPGTKAKPAQLTVERPASPAVQPVDLRESRSAFLTSLSEYAINKARATYGFSHFGRHGHHTCRTMADL
eukprot:gene10357-10515_t